MCFLTNKRCLILIAFIFSVTLINISITIEHEFDNTTIHSENIQREKRQIGQRGDLQHPAIISQVPVQRQLSSNVCSYKSSNITCLPDAHYRTFDGSCNNLLHPWWGKTNIPFRRLMTPTYADGQFLPRTHSVLGIPLPTPREVSNACSTESGNIVEPTLNAFFTAFAQFIDHDLTSAANGKDDSGKDIDCRCEETVKNPFCLNIPTPDMPDQLCMLFPRSSATFQRESACQLTVREQINQINSYLDASMIYGSTKKIADELRTFQKGLLKTTGRSLPPQTTKSDEGTCRDAQVGRGCFLCGDARSNENIGLTSLHTIFLRLHNNIATVLSNLNSFWTDDIIFQETRRIVIAIIQHIVYNEYIPATIGASRSHFGPYQYDASADVTISNEFATASYRFGHTLVNGFLRRFNNQHQLMDEISISRAIFRPAEAYNQQMGGLDTLIFGLLLTPTSKYDSMFNDVLRNHLFESEPVDRTAETKRFDLSAININRGRDHGLPTYNTMRQFCGLPRASSFTDLQNTIEPSAIARLASVYADVNDIDLYIGGISERSVSDGVVGPTFACLISREFNNIRRGDRFFYESQNPIVGFSPNQLNEIRQVTLSSVLCQTVEGILDVQVNALKVPNKLNNPHVPCSSIPFIDLSFWRE